MFPQDDNRIANKYSMVKEKRIQIWIFPVLRYYGPGFTQIQ